MIVTNVVMVLHPDGEGCARGIVHAGVCSPAESRAYEPRSTEFGAHHGDDCDCFMCCDQRGEHRYHDTVGTPGSYRGVCCCGWHSLRWRTKRHAQRAVDAHVKAAT